MREKYFANLLGRHHNGKSPLTCNQILLNRPGDVYKQLTSSGCMERDEISSLFMFVP